MNTSELSRAVFASTIKSAEAYGQDQVDFVIEKILSELPRAALRLLGLMVNKAFDPELKPQFMQPDSGKPVSIMTIGETEALHVRLGDGRRFLMPRWMDKKKSDEDMSFHEIGLI